MMLRSLILSTGLILSTSLLVASAAYAEPLLVPTAHDPITAAQTAPVTEPTQVAPSYPLTSEAPVTSVPDQSSFATERVRQVAAPAKSRAAPVRTVRTIREARPIRVASVAQPRRIVVSSIAAPSRAARGCDSLLCPSFVLIGVGY